MRLYTFFFSIDLNEGWMKNMVMWIVMVSTLKVGKYRQNCDYRLYWRSHVFFRSSMPGVVEDFCAMRYGEPGEIVGESISRWKLGFFNYGSRTTLSNRKRNDKSVWSAWSCLGNYTRYALAQHYPAILVSSKRWTEFLSILPLNVINVRSVDSY